MFYCSEPSNTADREMKTTHGPWCPRTGRIQSGEVQGFNLTVVLTVQCRGKTDTLQQRSCLSCRCWTRMSERGQKHLFNRLVKRSNTITKCCQLGRMHADDDVPSSPPTPRRLTQALLSPALVGSDTLCVTPPGTDECVSCEKLLHATWCDWADRREWRQRRVKLNWLWPLSQE